MSLIGQWDSVNGEVLRCPTVQTSIDRLVSEASHGAAASVNDRNCCVTGDARGSTGQ